MKKQQQSSLAFRVNGTNYLLASMIDLFEVAFS